MKVLPDCRVTIDVAVRRASSVDTSQDIPRQFEVGPYFRSQTFQCVNARLVRNSFFRHFYRSLNCNRLKFIRCRKCYNQIASNTIRIAGERFSRSKQPDAETMRDDFRRPSSRLPPFFSKIAIVFLFTIFLGRFGRPSRLVICGRSQLNN